MEIFTQKPQQTKDLGQKIANYLTRQSRGSTASILALFGELGSGKTTFVQGLAKGLGVPHRIVSPTFIMVRKYRLTNLNFNWFYHVDLYRVQNAREVPSLGIAEFLSNPENIVVIEWAEKIEQMFPKTSISVSFKDKGADKRLINIKNFPHIL